MVEPPEHTLSWRTGIARVAGGWRPLVAYEVLISLVATAVLGPLAVASSYRLIELSGEPVLTYAEIAALLLSPRGLLTLVVGLSVALGLFWLQYCGLILLIREALGGEALSLSRVIKKLAAAAGQLFALAAIQTVAAILVALPFLLLAALVYRVLLSDADINYFLSERPTRFWLAACAWGVLAVCMSVTTAWFFVRFAFALPACALDGQSCWQALRSSWGAMRGKAARLLLMLLVWQVLEQVTIVAAIAGLDQFDHAFAMHGQGGLTILVWLTVAVLLLDAVVLQLLFSAFAIGRALILTFEYERARQQEPAAAKRSPEPRAAQPWTQRAWGRGALAAMLVAAPAGSLLYAARVAHDVVQRRTVRVTAHRAGSRAAAENSLAALGLAIAAGADCVEIDVQLTADGQVVLMHDRDLRRMTGDPRDVSDVTLAELRQLRLRYSGPGGGEPVPTLAEFLSACDDRIRLNIELKETDRGPTLPQAVLDVLREHDFLDRAGVSCFRLEPLRAVRAAEPRVPLGMILSVAHGDATRLPVDFLSLNQRIVRGGLVRRAHRQGMEVHAWTVNDRDGALRLLDLGCDNLISSDPALMREVVDWYAGLTEAELLLMRLRRWMRD